MGSSKSKFLELAKDYNSKNEIIEKKLKKFKKQIEKGERSEKSEKNLKKIINKKKKSVNLNHISEDKIDEFIDSVLKDQNINIDYLPDTVEKQIYKNVLLLIFNMMDKTFDHTSFKFIGHEIKLTIVPSE
jgi:uncharacterized protein YpuA (DUF1002 family)